MSKLEPMLAPNDIPELKDIKWPMFGSKKMDGMRCVIKEGKLLARSMKPVPNQHVAEMLKDAIAYSLKNKVVFDGELYAHKPATFQDIMSCCRSKSNPLLKGLKFHMIDMLPLEVWDSGATNGPFKDNYKAMCALQKAQKFKGIQVIRQFIIKAQKRAQELLDKWEAADYEGMMLRDPDKGYRHGRATVKQHWLFKVKAFLDYDAKIIEVIEGSKMKAGVTRKVNPLGHREPVIKKGEREPNGKFGKFLLELEDGVTCEVGNWKGLTHKLRDEIWRDREDYLGRWVRFRGQAVGVKDRPRIPKDLEFRDDK